MESDITNSITKNSHILVCGATGFIGRNIVDFYAARGHKVTAVWHKCQPYETPNNVIWRQADLRDPACINELVKGHDIIIQAAATTSGSKEITSTPFIHVTDNVVMNSLLLRACYEHSVKHFVFFSCSIMYPSSAQPVKETDFNGDINEKYFGAGWTKVYLERMCEFYAGLGKSKHTVIRHGNIYGPYDKFDLERSHVCGATISKVLREKTEITIWGEGTESRDLLYVDDLVGFVDKALTYQPSPYALYNCGLGEAISVKNLAEMIVAIHGKHHKIKYDNKKPTIPFHLALDCSKAKDQLHWQPNTSLEAGLRQTITWWLENIDRSTLKCRI